MEVISLHNCCCDDLLELATCYTFADLDQTFVNSVVKLLPCISAHLCMGAFEDVTHRLDCELLAKSSNNELSNQGFADEKIILIHLDPFRRTY